MLEERGLAKFKLPWRLFVEWINPGEACFRSVERILLSLKTKFQEIDIVELAELGKALVIDGKLQSTLYDEYWYHEALVHPPMLAHPHPTKVLIIGGGEGATLREVLKHKSVREVVMVDVDEEMIKIAREHLVEWHQGAFNDGRVKIIVEDGRKFVENTTNNTYDVVILDLVDPTEGGPATHLYTREFYQEIYRILVDDGIMVTQATSPILMPKVYATIYKTISSVFPSVTPYITYVRSYNGLWGFVMASKKRYAIPSADKIDKMIRERIHGELKFYDSQTHQWMFSLPKPIRKIVEEMGEIATDTNPPYTPT
ncbi:MAG TPA: polyamine aminopropyltransferase [Pyrodictium sp.]|nr:polyamine aminopropyltransferase [Pyrodictium sp.]